MCTYAPQISRALARFDSRQVFALPLHNGHRKSRRHFEYAIQNFQLQSSPIEALQLFVLECMHRCGGKADELARSVFRCPPF